MNILDFILISILIACIYIGYFRGLFKTVIEFLGFLFGIISFYILYPIINNFLFKTKIKDFIIDKLSFTDKGQEISNYIFNKITNFAEQSISNSNILSFQQDFESLNNNNTNNEILNNFFKPITDNISSLFKNIDNNLDNFFNNFTYQISSFIAFIIISIITAIILTILITTINIFLTRLIKSTLKSYIINKFDKIGGICIGAISGLLLIYIITIILYIISIFASPLRAHLDGLLAPIIIKNFNGIVLTYIIKLILDFIKGI